MAAPLWDTIDTRYAYATVSNYPLTPDYSLMLGASGTFFTCVTPSAMILVS